MSPIVRGSLVAAIHVALLAAVGGVLLYERQSLPSVWVETIGVDPVLPIRGRYVALNLVVEPRGRIPPADEAGRGPPLETTLSVEDGRLVATVLPPANVEAMVGWRGPAIRRWPMAPERVWILEEPIAFFLPEGAPDPARLQPGEVLWAQVTVPRRGLPRPIRLEVRPAQGATRPAPTDGQGLPGSPHWLQQQAMPQVSPAAGSARIGPARPSAGGTQGSP